MEAMDTDHINTRQNGSVPALYIPVQGSDEQIEVREDELPADPVDIVDILKAELAPLDTWLSFAVAYFKQGLVDSFVAILNEGSDPVLEEIPQYSEAKKDRIAIFDTLAAYYTSLASKQKDKVKRDDLFNEATANYNKADRIDIREELTWVGKAVLLLCRGDVTRASDYFDNVLKANPKNVPALLGKGCIYFNKGSYDEALKCYRTVLLTNPHCSASVRLGLGLCYYRLNKKEPARLSFERVLQLDHRNVEAMVGLAIIELNTEGPKSIPKAVKLFKQAFELNPQNPMVLNHLADHYFFRNDFEKAQELALQAYHNTEVEKIKAESCFHIARAYHARGDYDNAFQYYYQSSQHWADFPLTQFRLGQMYLYKLETEKAVTCFEHVLTTDPNNYESLKILGSLYLSSGRKERAYNFLKRVTDLHPEDVDAWIELAQIIETTNYSDALTAYLKVKKIMEVNKQEIAPELYHNIGVLQHIQGKLKEAEESYRAAIKASNFALEEYKEQNITTTYNLARLQEEEHRFDEAETIYKSILQEHPNYTDCFMRLGCISQVRGQIYEASTWFKEVFTTDVKSPEAWSLIGQLHLSKDELLQAQKKFEKILETNRHDVYSLLSLGNIYYGGKFDRKDKEDRYLKHSFDFYWKVLQMDPNNIYAANGLGIYFAEKGSLNEAKDFFQQVREAADIPDVYINLGHVALSLGQHLHAVKLYQKCLKQFYNNKDATVLTYLAKAYFEGGKMEECRQTLLKTLHIAPANKITWFNLALAQEQHAASILRTEKRTLNDIKKAVNDLVHAAGIFKNLSVPDNTMKVNLVQRAEKHQKYCETTLELGRKQRARAEEQERILQEKREKLRALQEEQDLMKATMEENQQREEEERRREAEKNARESELKALEIAKSLTDRISSQKSGDKKSKKKNKDFIDDSEEPDAVEGDEDFGGDRKKDKASALSDIARRRGEKEEGEKKKKRKKKRNREEGEEEPEEGKKKSKKEKKDKKEKKGKKSKDKKKRKSKLDEFINDEEEEVPEEDKKSDENQEAEDAKV
eukprot:TRINITY_DN1439_c0_g2_i1.p1 TRINITY_DN1439_c0_g2~~TRINITY_DN1439_c0_g2_i1.p1  ORF type:complete len:1096 (-),score=375.65 TRINITY_DN1439_c0_g2_i1:61-3174(-)